MEEVEASVEVVVELALAAVEKVEEMTWEEGKLAVDKADWCFTRRHAAMALPDLTLPQPGLSLSVSDQPIFLTLVTLWHCWVICD